MKKIRLIGTRKEKAKGFYELMTHGSVGSTKLYEFTIDDALFKILKKKGVKFKEMK